MIKRYIEWIYDYLLAQSAKVVEYTDLIFAEWEDLTNKYPIYDTKQFDGEVPIMLELWGMRSTHSLPSLPGPLWSGFVALDRFLSMD